MVLAARLGAVGGIGADGFAAEGERNTRSIQTTAQPVPRLRAPATAVQSVPIIRLKLRPGPCFLLPPRYLQLQGVGMRQVVQFSRTVLLEPLRGSASLIPLEYNLPAFFRGGVMGRPFIVVGDRTSHGGVVVSGSLCTDFDGKAVARIGDKVTCPQKGHGAVTAIVTGDLTCIIDGSPVARHGDKTACGAILISSQISLYIDTESSSGSGTWGRTTDSGKSGRRNSEKAACEHHAYDLQFLVKGDKSGIPQISVPYKITLDNGQVFTGWTDKNGLTEKIGSSYPATATLEAPYHDNSSADAVCGYDTCCC